MVSAEITYANNLDRIETIRSDGRIDGADPSIAALTGRVEVRFADQVLVNQAIAGDPCELEFGYALPSGESFTFTVHAVYLPRPRIEIPGRRACRRPSTGRRPGTPRWAACAPPRSSTTSRSTEAPLPNLRSWLTGADRIPQDAAVPGPPGSSCEAGTVRWPCDAAVSAAVPSATRSEDAGEIRSSRAPMIADEAQR